MNLQTQGSNAQQELSIQAQAFGGLNTLASPLNLPYQDSPLLYNVITDLSGNVIKRKGTSMVYRNNESVSGASITSITTGLNYNLLVGKVGTSIRIWELFNNVATVVMTKANVWSDAVSNERASTVATSELEPRILFFTGTNKPVQLRFVEQQTTVTTTNTATFTGATRFKNATLSNVIVFVNRVRTAATAVSFSSNNLSVSVPCNVGDVVDVLLITWQWWAEARRWYGFNFFATLNRFNVVQSDQNVKLPPELTSEFEVEDVRNSTYPIFAYKESRRLTSNAYERVTLNRNPQTADQYTFGDGSIYNYSTTNKVNPSPDFLTFGTLQAGGNPSTVYAFRRRELGFVGVKSANVDVFVDGVKRNQILAASDSADSVYQNYWLFQQGVPSIIDNNNVATADVHRISFEALDMGVGSASFIEVVNTQIKHIGTSAIATRFDYNDGSYEPAFGTGTFFDYVNGYYPRYGVLYNSRLVLTGMAHKPLTVLFSALSDTITPGRLFNDYTINASNVNDNNAFDIVLQSSADDRCICSVEWQGSLFALTRYKAFRIFGGERPLSPTSRQVNFLSSVGCVNEQSVVQTDTNIMYLSDNGLYDLTPIVENGEYQVRERSIKIRDKFGITNNPLFEPLPFVEYDDVARLVYVNYPARGEVSTTRFVYVYNTVRDSWTEFTTYGGFNSFGGTPCIDRLLGNSYVTLCCTERDANKLPSNLVMLKWNSRLFMDYTQSTNLPNGSMYSLPVPEVVHNYNMNQMYYNYDFTRTQQLRAFNPNPIVEVQDVEVYYNYNGSTLKLVFGTDYVKRSNGAIYLTRLLPNGSTLIIRGVSSEKQYHNSQGVGHLGVFHNKVFTTNFNLTGTTLTTTETTGHFEWGQLYTSLYMSPMFTLDMLGSYKRVKHLYMFFDNREYVDTFKFGEQGSSQAPDQIVDTYRQEVNANIAVLYNADMSGVVEADVFGFNDIQWDVSNFDITPPEGQSQPFALFKEPLQGVGYSYQTVVFNCSPSTFKLCGYQFDVAKKGKRNAGRY